MVYLTLFSIDTYFDALTTDRVENIVGKGEIARNEIIESPFVHICDISLFAAELEEPKTGM